MFRIFSYTFWLHVYLLWKKYLFKSFAYFKLDCLLILLFIWGIICILNPFQIYNFQIVLSFLRWHFNIAVYVLQMHRSFKFLYSPMFLFYWLPVIFISYPGNHSQLQCHEKFPLWLLIRILQFIVITFRHLINFESSRI